MIVAKSSLFLPFRTQSPCPTPNESSLLGVFSFSIYLANWLVVAVVVELLDRVLRGYGRRTDSLSCLFVFVVKVVLFPFVRTDWAPRRRRRFVLD